MTRSRTVLAAALLALGSAGVLAWQAGSDSGERSRDDALLKGVRSEAAGSNAEDVPEQGVTTIPPTETSENVVQIITTAEGSVQSVRGIKGIDSVMLQNLETVLRMQEPPPPPEGGGGGGRAAAALMTMEDPTDDPLEVEVDARVEHMEFEIEGS